MAKQKKKRNKKYSGDMARSQASVTRLAAANRSKLGQWWHEKRSLLKPILIGVAVLLIIVWLISELVRVLSS